MLCRDMLPVEKLQQRETGAPLAKTDGLLTARTKGADMARNRLQQVGMRLKCEAGGADVVGGFMLLLLALGWDAAAIAAFEVPHFQWLAGGLPAMIWREAESFGRGFR